MMGKSKQPAPAGQAKKSKGTLSSIKTKVHDGMSKIFKKKSTTPKSSAPVRTEGHSQDAHKQALSVLQTVGAAAPKPPSAAQPADGEVTYLGVQPEVDPNAAFVPRTMTPPAAFYVVRDVPAPKPTKPETMELATPPPSTTKEAEDEVASPPTLATPNNTMEEAEDEFHEAAPSTVSPPVEVPAEKEGGQISFLQSITFHTKEAWQKVVSSAKGVVMAPQVPRPRLQLTKEEKERHDSRMDCYLLCFLLFYIPIYLFNTVEGRSSLFYSGLVIVISCLGGMVVLTAKEGDLIDVPLPEQLEEWLHRPEVVEEEEVEEMAKEGIAASDDVSSALLETEKVVEDKITSVPEKVDMNEVVTKLEKAEEKPVVEVEEEKEKEMAAEETFDDAVTAIKEKVSALEKVVAEEGFEDAATTVVQETVVTTKVVVEETFNDAVEAVKETAADITSGSTGTAPVVEEGAGLVEAVASGPHAQ